MENFFTKNKSIVTFLILEVVALTAFNFGNVSHIFALAGGFLAILAAVFVYFSVEDKKSLLPVLIPVAILFIVSLMGSLNSFSKGFSKLSNLALALALPGFLFMGFALRKFNDVKPTIVLLVVGAALAAITVFGLFSTLIEYGFFYRLIYKDTPNYYYNGIPYNVTKEMYWLNGFAFEEIYIEYGSLFAVLTAAFLPGLLFLSPKKERNEFIICASIGGVGLLTLLILPNFKAIILLAVVSLFAFAYRFLKNNKKVMKILGICVVCGLGLAFLFFLVSMINAAAGYKLPGFLNRVFVQNKFMTNVTPIYDALFAKADGKLVHLFGLNTAYYSGDLAVWVESGYFEVELLKEVGLFGTLIFGAFLIVTGYFLVQYLKHSEDHDYIKSVFVVLILAYFVYETFFNMITIAPHENSYEAFLRTPTLLVVLFVLGYVFTVPTKKEVEHE